jgi:hypothetical protein
MVCSSEHPKESEMHNWSGLSKTRSGVSMVTYMPLLLRFVSNAVQIGIPVLVFQNGLINVPRCTKQSTLSFSITILDPAEIDSFNQVLLFALDLLLVLQ